MGIWQDICVIPTGLVQRVALWVRLPWWRCYGWRDSRNGLRSHAWSHQGSSPWKWVGALSCIARLDPQFWVLCLRFALVFEDDAVIPTSVAKKRPRPVQSWSTQIINVAEMASLAARISKLPPGDGVRLARDSCVFVPMPGFFASPSQQNLCFYTANFSA